MRKKRGGEKGKGIGGMLKDVQRFFLTQEFPCSLLQSHLGNAPPDPERWLLHAVCCMAPAAWYLPSLLDRKHREHKAGKNSDPRVANHKKKCLQCLLDATAFPFSLLCFFSSPEMKERLILNQWGFSTLGKIPVVNAWTLTQQVTTLPRPEKV